MKLRNLVSKRYKETPADCVIASQALMMRGGYIKPVGNGIIRIDYIIGKGKGSNGEEVDKIHLLEINTTPGMTLTSFIPQQVKAAGLEMKDVLSDIVENQF